MKIAVLLKSGPGTDNAERALKTAEDMMEAGHSVNLFLLQEAVRFCRPTASPAGAGMIEPLAEKGLDIQVLTRDAALRGLDTESSGNQFSKGSYDSLVDLMESCDRVIGIL
ncbi:MAG: DsrE family protein [Desulfobacterales bacterium]